jgi:t-SNARE complex subunit (syntaxin)
MDTYDNYRENFNREFQNAQEEMARKNEEFNSDILITQHRIFVKSIIIMTIVFAIFVLLIVVCVAVLCQRYRKRERYGMYSSKFGYFLMRYKKFLNR